jgi:hypothetical protein
MLHFKARLPSSLLIRIMPRSDVFVNEQHVAEILMQEGNNGIGPQTQVARLTVEG